MTLWVTQRQNTVLPFHMVSCSLPTIFCPPLRSSMLKDMFTNYSVETFFLNALGKWKKAKHVRNADDAWLGMNPG